MLNIKHDVKIIYICDMYMPKGIEALKDIKNCINNKNRELNDVHFKIDDMFTRNDKDEVIYNHRLNLVIPIDEDLSDEFKSFLKNYVETKYPVNTKPSHVYKSDIPSQEEKYEVFIAYVGTGSTEIFRDVLEYTNYRYKSSLAVCKKEDGSYDSEKFIFKLVLPVGTIVSEEEIEDIKNYVETKYPVKK